MVLTEECAAQTTSSAELKPDVLSPSPTANTAHMNKVTYLQQRPPPPVNGCGGLCTIVFCRGLVVINYAKTVEWGSMACPDRAHRVSRGEVRISRLCGPGHTWKTLINCREACRQPLLATQAHQSTLPSVLLFLPLHLVLRADVPRPLQGG